MQKLEEALEPLLNLKRSNAYYAERLGVTIGEIKRARNRINSNISKDLINPAEDLGVQSESTNFSKGEKVIDYASDRPLTTEELKEISGHDGITVFLTMSWLKSHRDGVWTYSLKMSYSNSGFTSTEEVEKKLKELFPKDLQKFPKLKVKPTTDKVALVLIGDDHCGLILKNSQYGAEQSEEIYRKRLGTILDELFEINEVFSKVVVVSLGDELDGFNGFTTRGGHHLGSDTNKNQFDIFVNSRKEFYDRLFQSGIADEYALLNQNISNHSGNDLSYMCQRALELYIEAVYEGITVIHAEKTIQTYEIGNHVFGFVHGKDEKHQKSPMPLNLDFKTDNYLFEFYDRLGYSPSRDWISTISADIHSYSVNMGKHGRYVKIPSISSGSNWIEANFGASQPGALIEIVDPNKKGTQEIPVWF